MNRYKRKKSATSEEKDRKPNPYWTEIDEEEHAMVEDEYDEESDANSVSGRQEHEFEVEENIITSIRKIKRRREQ